MMIGLVLVMLLERWSGSGSFSPANSMLPLQARTTAATRPTTVVRKKHVSMKESNDGLACSI
jgi:hypothetical protein